MLSNVNHLSGLNEARARGRRRGTIHLSITDSFPHQARQAARKVIFKRADEYVKEYLDREKEEIRLRREARKTGDYYVPAQPKVYFVIRIKGSVPTTSRLPRV